MDFVTDLRFPHTDDDVAVPNAWIFDAPRSAGAEAFGLLVHMLSVVRPGVATPLSEIEPTLGHSVTPVAALVAQLVNADYFREQGNGRYALVHPARLGPVPV